MRILVVDDDPSSLMLAQTFVEELGHSCVTATDGDMAWRLFIEYQPEVLVSDRDMPGLNGVQLCRAIRKAARDSYTYIILVTSAGEHGDQLSGMEAGADDYLTKPLDPLALETRLLAARRVTSLHEQLAKYRTELAVLARTDPLTKLRNRLTVADDLDLLHRRSQRYGRSYSLALFDIDAFKPYNDTYGHQAGDEALRRVAQALDRRARQGDTVYRYGGEEFLVVLPEQSPPAALNAVERLRAGVELLGIPHAGSPSGLLTISGGVSSYIAGRQVSGHELLREADLALYRAKATAPNIVVGCDPIGVSAAGLSTSAEYLAPDPEDLSGSLASGTLAPADTDGGPSLAASLAGRAGLVRPEEAREQVAAEHHADEHGCVHAAIVTPSGGPGT
ncbi:MAG: diguanylate cyclase response regulator [Pseudonocardiales bacterium]|nr:MAG: diguanylate cyclase response regulator [Pseudonocardiales bacterium]